MYLMGTAGCGVDGLDHTSSISGIGLNSRLSRDRVGVNTHRPMGDDARFLFGKAKELGLGWVRIDVSWDDIEIAKGQYNWNRSDEPIKEAASRGLKILANLHGTPKWANNGNDSVVIPNRTEDWEDFCDKASRRYDGASEGLPRIEVFGIWNEPDGSGLKEKPNDSGHSNPQVYVDRILKPCANAIRLARPDAKTAGPELASETDYLKKIVASAGQSLDIITIHKYSEDPNRVMSHMDSVRSIVEGSSSTKGKAIWLTETGWSKPSKSKCWFPVVDDKTQAAKSRSLLSLIESKGWIQKVFFYELRDDDGEGACQWGMLRSNGSEKPWFGELKSYLQKQPSPDPGPDHPPSKVPNGSYRSTCRNERIADGALLADCKDKRGKYISSKLAPYQPCSDIRNDNGRLVCVPVGEIPSSQPLPPIPDNHEGSPPWGSYRNSCHNEEIRNGVLYEKCQNREGSWNDTQLESYGQCRDILNDNGNLKCN
ncbi:MAG: cellulase family glycosylhydrolase [Pseudomonadota bacterium]